MATYAIGDIQGCYDELRTLLEQIKFKKKKDRVWFVGDLVNRGPKSLETLRYVKSLGDSAITVLGNHDLHLLALAHGNPKHSTPDSSLEAILAAEDRDELLTWLRHRPLVHHDKDIDVTLLHAGLPPQWSLKRTLKCAKELENALRGPGYKHYFQHMYGNKPDLWDKQLEGQERLRFITNCLTRLRFCDMDGRLELKQKGSPQGSLEGLLPWYQHPQRKTRNDTILFGHWSTLGFYYGENVYALDSGCLWGGTLTALRIDKRPFVIHELACAGMSSPG